MRQGWRVLVAGAVVATLAMAPEGSRARVIVVGDSNATGLGVRPSQSWPRQLERLLDVSVDVYGSPGAALSAPYIGLGWSAQCVTRMRGIFRADVPIAILALGTNDSGFDTDKVRTAVRNILGSLVDAPATRWLCLTPPPSSEYDLARARRAIAEECAAAGAEVMDGEAVLSRSSDIGTDGIHLSRSGHRRLALALRRRLVEMGLTRGAN